MGKHKILGAYVGKHKIMGAYQNFITKPPDNAKGGQEKTLPDRRQITDTEQTQLYF